MSRVAASLIRTEVEGVRTRKGKTRSGGVRAPGGTGELRAQGPKGPRTFGSARGFFFAFATGFAKLLIAWNASFKFTNMGNERLLALTRQATSGSDADAERVCASGLLCQILSDHRNRGGAEPGVVTRAQLLADKVPLRCQKCKNKAKGDPPTRVSGSWVFWIKREEDRKSILCDTLGPWARPRGPGARRYHTIFCS